MSFARGMGRGGEELSGVAWECVGSDESEVRDSAIRDMRHILFTSRDETHLER